MAKMEQPKEQQMGPAEEVRLLRARIAELERMQQRQQTKDLAPSPANAIDDTFEFVDENWDDVQVDKFSRLSDQFAQLVTDQKELCARITAIESGLTTAYNHWDLNACHEALTVIGPEQLVVVQEACMFGSVFAKWPICKNSFCYYEVKIVDALTVIYIGLAPKHMPLNGCVGAYKCSYGYSQYHLLDKLNAANEGHGVSALIPFRAEGSTVGCGVDLATRQLIYTLNGKCLDTTDLFADSIDYLFPCVSFDSFPLNKIEANFGPNFKYEIANEKKH